MTLRQLPPYHLDLDQAQAVGLAAGVISLLMFLLFAAMPSLVARVRRGRTGCVQGRRGLRFARNEVSIASVSATS
jgi:hypothetical protein